ncbi:MAG: CopG family ribbon-helix-helix protein [Dehalococcoidia bacterium]
MARETTVQLSDEVADRLDQIAVAMECSTAGIIEQAIANYLRDEAAEVAAIAKELAEYRAGIGKLIPHEEVMREMRELIRARTGDANHLA